MNLQLKVIALVFATLLTSPATAKQPDSQFGKAYLSNNADCTMPFELARHFILVKTKINYSDKTYNFILDSGMPVSMVDKTIVSELNGKLIGSSESTDTASAKGTLTTYQVDSISVGNSSLRNTFVASTDLSMLSQVSGKKIDGILGDTYLQFFRVIIDYRSKQVTFSTSDTRVDGKYRISASVKPLQGISIPVQVDGQKSQIMVDTGAHDISLPFEILQKLDYPKEEYLESKGSMSGGLFGAATKDALVRIKSMSIGDIKLSRYPVNGISGNRALLGYKFLAHFLVTLDYPHDLVVLTPYGDEAFDENRIGAGLALMKAPDGKVTVTGLWENSPADKQHLQIGDVVSKINGKDASDYSQADLASMLEDDAIKQLILEIGTKSVTLVKSNLFL